MNTKLRTKLLEFNQTTEEVNEHIPYPTEGKAECIDSNNQQNQLMSILNIVYNEVLKCMSIITNCLLGREKDED